MQPLATLPDATNVKRSQARDIAEALVRVLRDGACATIRLYIGPDGVVGFGIGEHGEMAPLSLVGTYTRESTQAAIADDILAMERERIA